MPIYKEVIRTVFFVDSGTVDDDLSLDRYRVAVGAGLRFRLPFFGQGGPPVAIDLAVPVLKESGDQTQVISFDLAVPF
jgi:outer membrane protein insertion porin family